ncbi:MAG TPA: alpha-amylase family glycosyl hydrolase [Albitalea sp.]|nr:alpha-amylase family glycosyl hydrolase [Albitalea sp.]
MFRFPRSFSLAWWRFVLAALAFGASRAMAATPWQGADQLGGYLASDNATVTFRVFSQNATRIQVYLYRQPSGASHVASYTLTQVSGTPIWQVQVAASTLRGLGFDISPTDSTKLFTNIYYGYRAWGPNWSYQAGWTPGSSAGFGADVDTGGNRFNPNKLLLDPNALEVSHDPISASVTPATLDSSLYASGATDRLRDSAPLAPKGIVAMPWGTAFAALDSGTKPTRAAKDDIVYETHLRGLTQGDGAVTCRGTYQAAAAKIPYLQSLGINTIEFMPIQETDNDANDVNDSATQRSSTTTKGDNYWGYMTVNYFAPDRRYACDKSVGGPTREFVAMVKAFHDAGIKVMTDVVYNHTAEGGVWSNTDATKASVYGFRGLDNASYYLLTRSPGTSSDRLWYYDITGTGNTMNTHHAKVQNLIIDSLKYQRGVLGIDAFRFDLGIALGNTYDNDSTPTDTQRFYFSRTDTSTALAKVVAALPGVTMSSEPWGLAPNGQGYQLGQMPVGISEWNGGWRDVIRRAQNKYGSKDADATRGKIASRIAGSRDLFGDAGDGRNHPWYSVNFLDVHDGFTLKDLFSCNGQNTGQGWPLGPSDGGTADEDQWDNGANALQQRQQARTGFALLMLSAGVPIFHAGDEFLRSLNCNNNSYNVDSSGTWLNYGVLGAGTPESNFRDFAARMIQFRKNQPALRPDNFYASVDSNGNNMAALDWFGADKSYRTTYSGGDWWQATPSAPDNIGQNRTVAWRYDGSEIGGGDTILVLFNAEPYFRNFTLPWTGPTKGTWCRVTDTASWAEGPNQVDLGAATCVGGENTVYGVQARSLVILVAR